MPKISTSLRLLLLAATMSFALTSCFDRDKKCDPKPKPASTCTTPTTPTPTPAP
jgi:hypothetical protein